jgi:hypothetical protein
LKGENKVNWFKNRSKKESKSGSAGGPVAQSETIKELFNREKLDPVGRKILAFAMLYEHGVAPSVWVGPGPDPFAAKGESAEIRQTRFLASKIIPGYQPHFIPPQLKVDLDTAVASRQFRRRESLDVGYINTTLSVMLAELLSGHDLSNCSALSLSGNSVALGEARFALVVE